MPFDETSGSAAGRKGGKKRWKDQDPSTMRNKMVLLSFTQDECDMIDKLASAEGVSRPRLIIRAIDEYHMINKLASAEGISRRALILRIIGNIGKADR